MGHPDKGKGGIIEYPEFLRFVITNLYLLPFETSIDNYELSDSDNFSGNQTKIARPEEKRKIYSNYTPHREYNPFLRKRSTDRSKKISFSPLPLSLSLSKKKERSKAGNRGGWARVEEEGGEDQEGIAAIVGRSQPNPTQPNPSRARWMKNV